MLNTIKDVKELLLNKGFTVISHKDSEDKYLTYSKDNKFAYIQFEYEGFFNLTSVYKPSFNCGTGCAYFDTYRRITLKDLTGALNYRFSELNPTFYKDIADYLQSHFRAFEVDIFTNKSSYSALDVLDGYYIFKSDKYAPVISKNHTYLFNNYYEDANKTNFHKAIFQIIGGKIEPINHNINLFEDYGIMQNFKNRILGTNLKTYIAAFDGKRLNAIGFNVYFENIFITGLNEDNARLNLYNEYEHICNLKLSEVK